MFIILGIKRFQKELGKSFVYKQCNHCHNNIHLVIRKITSKFTLFWLPLFTTSNTYCLLCPICNHGMEISKEEADEYQLEPTT